MSNAALGQVLQHMAWLLRDHAEAVSGAYRSRCLQRGVEGGGWRDLTDEEKLEATIQTMNRRCHFIGECVDRMLEAEYSAATGNPGRSRCDDEG